MTSNSTSAIGVGFGTAALGGTSFQSVTTALGAGFRKFDTAEANWWYDQKTVGKALVSFFVPELADNIECHLGDSSTDVDGCRSICSKEDLQVSTKIPPWELKSIEHIRARAAQSREELLGFCDVRVVLRTNDDDGDDDRDEARRIRGGRIEETEYRRYPLDVYYIHAPACWPGWHPDCDGVKGTLQLRESWLGMEEVVGDGNAKRIGLSNVRPDELLDIIQFVKDRENLNGAAAYETDSIPRMPDVLQAYADPLHPASELRQICYEHNIEFVSYSTLGTQHRGGSNPVLGNDSIITLAEHYERSTAEIVLSWALQRGMSVIPRSSNEVHIRQLANLLTGDPFLDEEDLAIIDEISLDMNEL